MITVDIDSIGVRAFVVTVLPDGEPRFKAINRADMEATGFRAADLIGQPFEDCLPLTVAEHVRARFTQCISERALHEYDERLEFQGKKRWWRTTLTPVLDPSSGRVVEIVGIAVEITEHKKTEDELANVAFQDPLTGLANRRRLESDVGSAMAEAAHTGRGFGLVQIDLDRFKPINDTYGHRKGDDVLRHIASLLKLTNRRDETVARIGGDEFAMLVRASSETELAGKVIALRRFLDRSMCVSDVEVNVGASIGGALWTDGQTFEDLLAVADVEMYRQKKRQRRQAA